MTTQTPAHSAMAWRMVALAFLAQNCILGFTYGTYGTILKTLQEHYGISRAIASAGPGMVMIAISLLSPIVGTLLQRASLRMMMVAGALINTTAFVLLSRTTSFNQVLGLYVVIGIGVCISGILGPTTLISRWFDTDRGKALGIINLPIFIFVAPMITAYILSRSGLSSVFLSMAVAHFILSGVLLFVRDRAAAQGEGASDPARHTMPDSPPIPENVAGVLTTAEILKNPTFWLLTLPVAIVSAGSGSFMVHFVPHAMLQGHTIETASKMLSVYGLTGIFGTYAFGWLADKITPSRTLALTAFSQAVVWVGLMTFSSAPALFILSALVGAGMTSIIALYGAAINQLFGPQNVSRVMGFGYFIKLPFVFGGPPLMGFFFDRTGGYAMAFLAFAAAYAVSAAMAFVLKPVFRPTAAGADAQLAGA